MCTEAIIAARLGGDEFIILLPDGNDNAGSTADRLIAAVQTPFRYHCSPVVVGASTGIAYCPEHGKNAFAVMSAADLALYRAKASGKGRSVLSGRRFPSRNSGDGALSVSWKLPCGTSSTVRIRYSECQYMPPAVKLPALNRAQRGGNAGISWPSGSAEASHCHHCPAPNSVSYSTVLTCLRCR